MIRTSQWKYVHFPGWPSQLFDFRSDPKEFHDLGRSPDHEDVCRQMQEHLTGRLLQRKNRTRITDEQILNARDGEEVICVMIGEWARTPN